LRFQQAIEKIADCIGRDMMKTLRTMVLVLGLAGSILALHAQSQLDQSKAAPASRQQARATFENVCAACHGLDGRGGERGPDIVSRREIVGRRDSDLLAVLRDGRPGKGMPGFAASGEKQLLMLVAYVRELQGARQSTSVGGDPARGRELFFGKAGCSECHMVAGQGGFFAAELSTFAAKKTADELRSAIVSPEKGRDPRKGPVTINLIDGKVLSGIPRNEDNFSLQLQTSDGSFHFLKKAEIVSLTRSGHIALSADHGRRLSAGELHDLMGFLAQSAGSGAANKSSNNSYDGDEE